MVLVAPPLVVTVLVVLLAPIGLPAKFIVPPPLPPVKLKAVLFHRLLLALLREKMDALLTLTLTGASQAKLEPGDSVKLPLSMLYALDTLVVPGVVATHESSVNAPAPALVKFAALVGPA